jgi:hypothetical protein
MLARLDSFDSLSVVVVCAPRTIHAEHRRIASSRSRLSDIERGGMNIQLIDRLPILGVFVLIVVVSLLFYEAGFRFGRWWQVRTPGEQEVTGVLVGSILALVAFLLAVTMSMASDRFDTRRGLVLDEANAIGTTYLRAGYLPEPARTQIREKLREYAPLRIATNDQDQLQANINRSVELQNEIWSIGEQLAPTTPQGDLMSLFLDSVNNVIDIHEQRVVAGIYARVPETVLLLLLGASALTLGMVGYSAGLALRRGLLSAVVLAVTLAAVLTIVVDLDRPRDGFLVVSQQPIQDVINQMNTIGP